MVTASDRQWTRRVLTAGVLAALLSPVIRNADGLPLSTYPMFAGTRSNEISIVAAVGVTAGGEAVRLSMPEVADTRSPLIAQTYLNDAVARGDADVVCKLIAGRAPHVDGVEIASERHDTVKRVRGEPSMLQREVLASCSVGS